MSTQKSLTTTRHLIFSTKINKICNSLFNLHLMSANTIRLYYEILLNVARYKTDRTPAQVNYPIQNEWGKSAQVNPIKW